MSSSRLSRRSFSRRWVDWVLGRALPFDLIYAPELESRLKYLIDSTVNTCDRIHKGIEGELYSNILLHGPPGTGKTLFAQTMIRHVNETTGDRIQWKATSGAALLSGGIPVIDEMFKWIESQKGSVIFVDEADILFEDRSSVLHFDQKKVVNYFLERLGSRSNRYMFIFTTNRPMVFDEAMRRRIDEVVYIPLPGLQERERVLTMYRDSIVLNKNRHYADFIASAREVLTDEKLHDMAVHTEGVSNGDLQGIMSTMCKLAYVCEKRITESIVDRVVQQYVDKDKAFNGMQVTPPHSDQHKELSTVAKNDVKSVDSMMYDNSEVEDVVSKDTAVKLAATSKIRSSRRRSSPSRRRATRAAAAA